MKLYKFLKSADYRFIILSNLGLYNHLSDEAFLKKKYKARFGKTLDLKNPKTFNEKLQWLKLHNRDDRFTTMVDKENVKKYVAERIGNEYVIDSLGVWNSFDEIDFEKLPNQFVLKCTHDSGGLVICRDKDRLNFEQAKKKIEKSLGRNYYMFGREWPYKNVKPRILAEKYMQDENSEPEESLRVYKIMTFNGVPKIIQTIQNDKTPNEVIDYFDVEWNLLKMRQNFPNSNKPLARPATLDKMLELASRLAEDIPFLRIDFYEVNKQVYFSEFTFYSDSGMAKFYPEEWDTVLGNWIDLSKIQTDHVQ